MKKEELQKFVESFPTLSSILSVEKTADGSIGTIRIEAGNQIYIKSMEKKTKVAILFFPKPLCPDPIMNGTWKKN